MGRRLSAKFLEKCAVTVKTEQLEELRETSSSKNIHGVYYKQCDDSEDTSGCHIWLTDGRFQARTEALVVAAQDGVIRAYKVES